MVNLSGILTLSGKTSDFRNFRKVFVHRLHSQKIYEVYACTWFAHTSIRAGFDPLSGPDSGCICIRDTKAEH